jgi:hypothetical protein
MLLPDVVIGFDYIVFLWLIRTIESPPLLSMYGMLFPHMRITYIPRQRDTTGDLLSQNDLLPLVF